MFHPARSASRASSRHETVLKSPVLALNHAITLGMVGRGELVVDAQTRGELIPQVARKLTATVCDDGVRDAKTGDPMTDQGTGTGPGGNIRQGDCLKPPGITVNDGHQIGVTFRLREGPHQVKVQRLSLIHI